MTAKACFLRNEAQLDLQGQKIAAFLQGQLTCDTRPLSPTRAVAGALCNPKGRVITDLWVLQRGDDRVGLRLRTSLAEKTQSILARYAQFSRISVVSRDDSVPLGLYAMAPAELDTLLPAGVGECRVEDRCYWLRRGPLHGEVGALDETGEGRLQALAGTLTQGDESHWQAEDLRQGHFAVEASESERFTPQALNYDETGRVAFDKGCYTGQEVVARLHYKGQSKRRLSILRSSDGALVTAGDTVTDEAGDACGSVLRSTQDQHGATLVAAELIVERRKGNLQTGSGDALALP